ncbi:MAG: hypothetical protein C1942_04765 [Prosthecochloris sp.]|uniref:porin n=1 Tax=Prosthecochloris sp. TaxID=290513 RepID=UPI0013CAE3D2|nr:porin [Prosthecochloris sp.]NEX11999.1 hypothetical protein [Prosthecochloris sp.]
MKKMLSLVFALVLLAQAAPATAEIKFSGDAQVRPRGEFTDIDGLDDKDDMKYYYRLRLRAAADLGDGFFAKALISSETPGWLVSVGDSNSETYDLGVSQLYFGRMMENSHYMMGRLPLNSFNNPVFDISMYPFQATEIPTFIYNNDRIYGFNYGTKVGPGELNATLCVLNNDMTENDVFEDGYAVHVAYKTNIGNVTFEPQLLAALTDADIAGGAFISGSSYAKSAYNDVTPFTVGANVTIPANKTTFTVSGFYTWADGEGTRLSLEEDCCDTQIVSTSHDVDYSAYLLRIKAQNGPITAWLDYNAADDDTDGAGDDYTNMFIWAQYNWKVHESSMGSFTIAPTVRYLATDYNDAEASRLRTELWASVSF